jgi:threonine/homoserine/homoserine lactone efflux protein
VLSQSLALGFVQIAVSISVNAFVAMTAGSIAGFLARRARWLAMQRWMMGTVLTGLAARMTTETQR